MPKHIVHAVVACLSLAVSAEHFANGQQVNPNPEQAEKSTLASGIDRVAGQEASSHIRFVRLALAGTGQAASADDAGDHVPTPPMLIAQCTLRPNGKSFFELFATFSGTPDMSFYPPWTPTSKEDLFPPRTEKVKMTMEFLGYTHVKPVRREWEIPVQTPGQYRYNPPGGGSSNLEEIAYYLRYLLALPTLRLTLDNRSAEFATTPLLNEIRKEPLCRSAGL
jgi:hypothetical protein